MAFSSCRPRATRRSRARALRSQNLKKKRDCSRSKPVVRSYGPFVLKERNREGKLEKMKAWRKKERWKERKKMKERTVGIILSLNVKYHFDIFGRYFFDFTGFGAGAGHLNIVHDIYISCSFQWLFQQILKATLITVSSQLFIFLCLFTLLYFMTFVNLSTGSKTATIFSSRKKNHHEFHLPLTKIKNILTPYRLFRFNYN